ncbi:hypothetical protein MFLAVUS_001288 [Mucor flavus]|uniref:Zn(2)-C6 fungal-type domain-containing protein n=1 Tax=Mucor flavus TaxID=439312 RepID=A0ABP9YM10_9FUNG
MDTSYNYPQLFDMEDTDLFQGLNLSDNTTIPSPNHMYNNFDKKLSLQHANQDIYNSLASASNNNNTNSYLHYLQSNNNNNNNNDFYYDTPSQVMLMAPTMDLSDYDYFNQQTDQKQQYNWLYDPIDSFLPSNQPNMFCDNSIVNPSSLDSIMTENMDENITVEGGMSRGYVSLSDVNSFVAKADSKHSCLLQVPNDFNNQRRNEFSSSESTTNEDSEDDYSDSETEFRWPLLNSSFSTPTAHDKQKLMIKIKKPTSTSSALPSPYGEHPQWGLISPKLSKSANTYRNKYRKSASNIYNMATATKKKNKLLDNTKRRGSAPQRLTINHNHSTSSLGSLHSSSSLSSLSNTLQRSMRVSDSMNFLSRHSSDEEEEAIEDDEEDKDDDEYQIRTAHASSQLPTKKGRNVDKACNHCKRSHLRCDDMRPCRRCVATGKTGCKDVQHKPRGRPKLHKKQ